jgi:hypothetical protein
MKINYKTVPALECLKKGDLTHIPFLFEDLQAFRQHPEIFQALRNSFKQHCSDLKGNIYKVSESFMNSADKAHEKLSALYVDMVKTNEHDFKESAVFIFKNYIVFYFNSFLKENNDIDVLYMATDFSGAVLEFYVQGKTKDHGIAGWVCQRTANEVGLKNMSELPVYLVQMSARAAVLCMFIKYADVETKTVHGKSKRRFGDPYRNDTDFPITHLDSKWFTNIVRSEGFSVRGHFRLQPKKVNGEWTKELIWINDFEKHGYTSKARILNQED